MNIEVYQIATVAVSLLAVLTAVASLLFAHRVRSEGVAERLASLETRQAANAVEIFRRLDRLEKRLFPDPAPADAGGEQRRKP